MVSAAPAVSNLAAPSPILSVAGAAAQSAPQSATSEADTFDAQYSPQIYSVVNGAALLEPTISEQYIAFPPLPGPEPILIPGAPPSISYPPLIITLGGLPLVFELMPHAPA